MAVRSSSLREVEKKQATISCYTQRGKAESLEAYRPERGEILPLPARSGSFFEEKQINNPTPALDKETIRTYSGDYQNFYKELYPFGEPSAFLIHLNVDYPFNFSRHPCISPRSSRVKGTERQDPVVLQPGICDR